MKLQSMPLVVQVMGYYPPHLGGAERVTQMLAENLADRGSEVVVLTSAIPLPATEARRKHLRIIRLKAFEFAHTPFMPGLLRQLLRLPKNTLFHLHLAQAYYPELVYLVAKIRKQPYVLHFHLDLQPSGLFGKLFLLYKAIVLPRVIKGASKVIVFNEEQQTFVHERYDVARKDIAIVPNGVDMEYFRKPRAAKAKKSYNLLYAGRLASQKRVHIIIDALAHMKTPITLTIVGDGEDRAELEQLVRDHKLTNVRFEGFKPADELINYYGRADVLVVSSEREGMSLTVLEALAAGLPIVASNAPGLGELLKDVGVLVDESTGPAFAKALDTLLRDPQALARLSLQSTQAAQAYSSGKVTDAVVCLYDEVIRETS